MEEYRVKIGKDFEADIERIYTFLFTAEYTSESIRNILEQIYRDLKKLKFNPKIGAELNSKTSIPNRYRYLMSGQYLLFYKIFENEKIVQVYHIYHSKENYLVKLNLG